MQTRKIQTFVITVQNESPRSQHLRAELQKLEPWCDVHIQRFQTPCADYKGSSDHNSCVQRNLYENHQRCAQIILDRNLPYGLVCESDIAVDDHHLPHTMDGVQEWLALHPDAFDLFLLGGQVASIDSDHAFNSEHVVHVLEYAAKSHAIVYSADFCRKLVKDPWPGFHFDFHWALQRRDLRIFMTRRLFAGVHHERHMREMVIYNSLCAIPNLNTYTAKSAILGGVVASVLVLVAFLVTLGFLIRAQSQLKRSAVACFSET